jgi:hypothetical protein
MKTTLIATAVFVGLLYGVLPVQAQVSTKLKNSIWKGGGTIYVDIQTTQHKDSLLLGISMIDVIYRKTQVGDTVELNFTNGDTLYLAATKETLPQQTSKFLFSTWKRDYYCMLHKSLIEKMGSGTLTRVVFYSQPQEVISELSAMGDVSELDVELSLDNANKRTVVAFKKISKRSRKRFSYLVNSFVG